MYFQNDVNAQGVNFTSVKTGRGSRQEESIGFLPIVSYDVRQLAAGEVNVSSSVKCCEVFSKGAKMIEF